MSELPQLRISQPNAAPHIKLSCVVQSVHSPTGPSTGKQGARFEARMRTLLFPAVSTLAPGTTDRRAKWVRRRFPGGESGRGVQQTDHSPTSSTEVKEGWSCTSTF